MEYDVSSVTILFFFLSSGGWGIIKLELTTLPRIFIRVVCRFTQLILLYVSYRTPLVSGKQLNTNLVDYRYTATRTAVASVVARVSPHVFVVL